MDFDFRHYGYTSMIELCAYLPDVFTIEKTKFDDRETCYRLYQSTSDGARQKVQTADTDPLGIKAYSKAKKNVLLLLRHLTANHDMQGCPVSRLGNYYKDRYGEELRPSGMKLPHLEAFLEKLAEDDIILIERDLVSLSLDQQVKLALTLNGGPDPVLKEDQRSETAAAAASVSSVGPQAGLQSAHEICLQLEHTPEVITTIQIDDFVEVLVYEIWNPSKFYVRMLDRGFNKQFRAMEEEMG